MQPARGLTRSELRNNRLPANADKLHSNVAYVAGLTPNTNAQLRLQLTGGLA